MGPLLVVTGLTAAFIGAWRSYGDVNAALGLLVHPGEPTRAAIERARPIHVRPRLRRFARRLVGSTAWLDVAFYGLFLASVGWAAP